MIAALSLALEAAAATLGPGMTLPALTLTDQHDAAATIGPDVRLVLYTRDMDGADIVEEALAENGAALLEGAHAVTVSDISRMPGVITRLFALPAMRKRPYRMILDRDGAPTADFPWEEDKVTALFLEQMKIQRVEYVDTPAALRALLETK
jgi:hypothetical protein